MTVQRTARIVGALLALTIVVVVLAITVTGLGGLVIGLVLTEPWSHGRMVAAGFLTVGLALLVVVHALDPLAVPNAAQRARTTASRLLHTVASGGR